MAGNCNPGDVRLAQSLFAGNTAMIAGPLVGPVAGKLQGIGVGALPSTIGVAGTLGFATAFAIPFVVLSMFPSLLVRLPRAGGWMNNLKVVMGFLEIAAAVKFFSTAEFIFGLGLLPREVFLAVWAGVCLLIVLYILGTFQLTLDTPVERIGGVRAFFAVVYATLGLWFAAGMLGKPLAADLEALLPPENYHELLHEYSY